jgi:hypothetical protein
MAMLDTPVWMFSLVAVPAFWWASGFHRLWTPSYGMPEGSDAPSLVKLDVVARKHAMALINHARSVCLDVLADGDATMKPQAIGSG